MSRDWFAVYTDIVNKPKYRRLGIAARGALFHVWAIAGRQKPEATWPDRHDLEDSLELDGWDNPAGVIDELVQRGWLDVDDRERVLVHDWDEYQLAVTQAVRQEYERDRKQDWRRRRSEQDKPPLSKNSLPGTGTGTQQDITVSRFVRDTSGTRSPRETTTGVPSEGECRVCGGYVRDTESDVQVGPGWIAHAVHPEDFAA